MDGNQQEVLSFDTFHPSSHISSLSFVPQSYNFQIIQIGVGTMTTDIAEMVTSAVLTAHWLLSTSHNK